MNELVSGIYKIKSEIPDIYDKPRILLAYLFDYFPDREEEWIRYAPVILSDISHFFNKQLKNGKFDSVEILKKVTQNSNIDINIANMYLRILFDVEGISELFAEYMSNDRSAEEYYQMACLQKTEKGIQNPDFYVELLEKASEKGHLTAKHSVALFYLKGKYVQQNINKGFSGLMECADKGDSVANYEIYTYSKRYKGVISENTAFEYLKRAAMLDMRDAEYDLAMLYYENATDEDYKKAIDLLKKCADKNDAGAMYQLALCYRYGHGTNADINKAMELLRKAAGLGHKTAKEIVGG